MNLRALAPCALLVCSFACASPPPAPSAPAPIATLPPPGPGMPPAAAADVGTAADWNAAPTNGSPGVDVPKLSGNELLGNTDFGAKTYLPWTTSFTPRTSCTRGTPGRADGARRAPRTDRGAP